MENKTRNNHRTLRSVGVDNKRSMDDTAGENNMTIDDEFKEWEAENNKELRTISEHTGHDYLDLLVENVRLQESALKAYAMKLGKIPNQQQEITVYRNVLREMQNKYRNETE